MLNSSVMFVTIVRSGNVSEFKDVLPTISHPTDRDTSLLGEKAALILYWILFTVLCQAIDVFGTVTNIINIICFAKQGFSDPVNVSLLGLAISDVGCLTTLMFTNLCYTPAFSSADLPFDISELQSLASGWPHVAFSRITCWITAFITLERCLCITLPLKVKDIVTSKRVIVVIVSIFVVLISSMAPVYVVNRPGMKYFPHLNKSLIGIIYTHDREQVEQIFYAINSVFIPFCAFALIIICTIILVVQLQKRNRWREKSATSEQADSVSSRNEKVAKMIVMISTIFIACFTPLGLIFIAMSLEPEFSLDGKYQHLLRIVGGVCVVFESINSSANIFVYYHMSSKYRETFNNLLCRRCKR